MAVAGGRSGSGGAARQPLHLILGALGAGFFWWFYLPQTEQIDQLQGDLKKARAELERLRRVEQDLRAFKKEFKDVEARFTQATASLGSCWVAFV